MVMSWAAHSKVLYPFNYKTAAKISKALKWSSLPWVHGYPIAQSFESVGFDDFHVAAEVMLEFLRGSLLCNTEEC